MEPTECPACGQKPTVEFNERGHFFTHQCHSSKVYIESNDYFTHQEDCVRFWNQFLGEFRA